jgi:sugar/nucleoside kinase (ribokinase family)
MNPTPSVRIGVIGDAGLDTSGELTAAARLAALIQWFGAQAALAALVPDDSRGDAIRAMLHAAGVDLSRVEASPQPSLKMGDLVDVAGLFGMDAVLIAVSDPRLHRFLVDLPVHTAPNARLIGLLDHLAASSEADAWETVLRHDAVVATVPELSNVTGTNDAACALEAVQRAMIGHNLRTAAILGEDGAAWIIEKSQRTEGSASSFDRLAAAVTVVFAARRPWSDVFELASSQ